MNPLVLRLRCQYIANGPKPSAEHDGATDFVKRAGCRLPFESSLHPRCASHHNHGYIRERMPINGWVGGSIGSYTEFSCVDDRDDDAETRKAQRACDALP